MKPRKLTRYSADARTDECERLVTRVETDHVAPAHGDPVPSNPPVRQRGKKARRGGTKYRKAQP